MNTPQRVYMLIGNIGTGKTTTAQKLIKKYPEAVYVNDDTIAKGMSPGMFYKDIWTEPRKNLCRMTMLIQAKTALACGLFPIIIDTPNMSKAQRAQFIGAFLDHTRNMPDIVMFIHDTPGGVDRKYDDCAGKVPLAQWLEVEARNAHIYEEPTKFTEYGPWPIRKIAFLRFTPKTEPVTP